MMQLKDWISFFVGAVVFLLGFLPILSKIGSGASWFSLNFLPIAIFSYIAAAAGFYLMIESIIEITNSNIIGWWSFIIACIVLAIGVPPMLNSFGAGPSWFAFPWLSQTIYHIVFMVEGVLLMIACFAMEL